MNINEPDVFSPYFEDDLKALPFGYGFKLPTLVELMADSFHVC